jgi:hypothetical protein
MKSQKPVTKLEDRDRFKAIRRGQIAGQLPVHLCGDPLGISLCFGDAATDGPASLAVVEPPAAVVVVIGHLADATARWPPAAPFGRRHRKTSLTLAVRQVCTICAPGQVFDDDRSAANCGLKAGCGTRGKSEAERPGYTQEDSKNDQTVIGKRLYILVILCKEKSWTRFRRHSGSSKLILESPLRSRTLPRPAKFRNSILPVPLPRPWDYL